MNEISKVVSISLAPALIERVDKYAKKINISRSAAMSVLLSKSLEFEEAMELLREKPELWSKITQAEKEISDQIQLELV